MSYNPEYYLRNKERIDAQHREYYQNNKEKIKQKHRKYRKRTKTKWKEYYRNYPKNHPEIIKKSMNKYRNSLKGKVNSCVKHIKEKQRYSGNVTKEDIMKILLRDNFHCIYCKIYVGTNFTIDHIHSNKGNEVMNMAVACESCNSSKHNYNVFDWCKQKGYEIPDIIKN